MIIDDQIATKFSPFPELHSKRLVLRRLTLEDAPELYFLRTDPIVLKYLARKPAASISAVKDFILQIQKAAEESVSILWAIALDTKPGELIGTICFWNLQPENHRAEIGYVLHPFFWRKGLMKEAVDVVMNYGFDKMKLHRVEARLSPENSSSVLLLEKCGFKKEAHFREDVFFNGEYQDTVVYSKLCTD